MAESTVAEKPLVTLHWLDTSRAQRMVWLLEECKGMDYKIDVYKRGKDMLAPKELKDVHPLGKSPVITVKTSTMPAPRVIAESGFITEYLCENFATHLIPKKYQEGKEGQVGCETEQWMRYKYFIHYAEGSLFSIMLIALFMDQIRNAPMPFFIKPIIKQIPARVESMYLIAQFKTHYAFLEEQLKTSPEGGKYLCGKDLTGADILMSFPLFIAKSGRSPVDISTYPNLSAYIKLLEANEVYRRSLDKTEEAGGDTKAML